MRGLLLLLFTLPSFFVHAQNEKAWIRKIYDEALSRGHCYEDLRSLCKDVGARLTGSAEAQMAIEWGEQKMKNYGFDTVYLQEIEVPHWERGNKEAAWVRDQEGNMTKLNVLALGGSIGTDGLLRGELIEFKSLKSLEAAPSSLVKDKVVFLNQPMDQELINTFSAYGACYPIRGHGAAEAGYLGAKAVIIRSLGLAIDDHPHTGSMYYRDTIPKIPAAAVSTQDAELLSDLLSNGKQLECMLEMDCRNYPNAKSYNVIGQMYGQEKREEIISFGGHLDSWDAGEGAHDDGAGIVHALEALRILKELGYQPKRTLRAVFFMNEENGNMGGKSYAKLSHEAGENHVAALESDRGGFSPRGYYCDGNEDHQKLNASFKKFFKSYYLHIFSEGFGGVDIMPLKEYYPDIALFGLAPDSQRYFDFHHSPNDIFENVNKRELELGAASMAAMIYLVDQKL